MKDPRHDITPLRRRLLIAFLTSIVGVGASASPERAAQPRLVVGIMVEDLQEDYIDLLREYFSTGGFNMLFNKGVVFQNVDYATSLDPTAATAVIYTGASPAVNGIPADEVFDLTTLQCVPVFSDPTAIGNYTDQALSPKAMPVTTISDEIRISGNGNNHVYSIAPDPGPALVMASHAGDCGIWLNNSNDSWATTAYYRETPSLLNTINRRTDPATRLDSVVWTPMYGTEHYRMLPASLTKTPFRYDFRKKGPARTLSYKNSPEINTEITSLAIEYIDNLDLGNHEGAPDMLNLALTASPYSYSRNADNRYELIDTYYRLDRDIERLFKAIDKKVGLPNTLIFLAATPPSPRSKRDDPRWQIPYGEFSTRKAISLLNLYFIALYGNGNWVVGYHDGQFFLNRDLIQKESKPLDTMRAQAAAFLEQMAGVASAYSLDDIIENRAGLYAQPLKQNTNVSYAGDVRITVYPGWEILDDYNYSTGRPDQVSRLSATTAPVFIYAPGVAPQTIGSVIDARTIAPTVTRLLRIRSPNGAAAAPIPLEF